MPDQDVPVMAQVAVVNKMVLPLLEKMGINVTVTTQPNGMRLDLAFSEPAKGGDAPLIGTDDPETARQLWALRERIEQYKADHPELADAQ